MTSPEQDKILEALSAEHGAVKVLPLRGTDAVLACGWTEVLDWRVCPHCHGHGQAQGDGSGWDGALRYATEQEIADAHEQDAVRELLSAAGLR